MKSTVRHYSDILEDIEKHMTDNHLIEDLKKMKDWQKEFSGEAEFCSATATWLYTFQVYTTYNETLFDLIDEFAAYCGSKGIHFI